MTGTPAGKETYHDSLAPVETEKGDHTFAKSGLAMTFTILQQSLAKWKALQAERENRKDCFDAFVMLEVAWAEVRKCYPTADPPVLGLPWLPEGAFGVKVYTFPTWEE